MLWGSRAFWAFDGHEYEALYWGGGALCCTIGSDSVEGTINGRLARRRGSNVQTGRGVFACRKARGPFLFSFCLLGVGLTTRSEVISVDRAD